VASAESTESKKLDAETEFDDFDAASDMCDFGFVLTPPVPAAEKPAEARG
jgi:hypothetical protein